jgi:hypothetical protein
MGYAKNYQKKTKQKSQNQSGQTKAYRPKPPYSSVEGNGTPPFAKLDRGAVWVLMRLYAKFNGRNRYNLSLTYKEVKHEMSSRIFTRSIWQCIGYGFVDPVRFGRLEKNCSLYGLSNRWRKLWHEPEKLENIGSLLREIERLKKQKGSVQKRMKIKELRHKILKLGGWLKHGKHI